VTMVNNKSRKTLSQIKHVPTPKELYQALMSSEGWPYKTEKGKYLIRDHALVALLYLGDFRISEVLALTKENFAELANYVWVKDVKVGKKRAGKIEYREAKLPLKGERVVFTQLILDYLRILGKGERLFPWSLKVKTFKVGTYTIKDGLTKNRLAIKMVGTTRAWQIVNALLPEYTQHWLRAFGYNYDYDNMDHDIMAVSDKTKADPRSLQPYLRRRYEKYPVR
jgi:integrase